MLENQFFDAMVAPIIEVPDCLKKKNKKNPKSVKLRI